MENSKGQRIAVVVLSISMYAAAAQAEPGAAGAGTSIPERLKGAVGCLVAAEFVEHDLASLGLHVGDEARVRFRVGSVPGMAPTPGQYYVAVYSADERHGWLLIADPNSGGGFSVVRNAYQLTRIDSVWRADEGNGGLATYGAMSRFASALFRGPRYRVPLLPRTKGCGEGR